MPVSEKTFKQLALEDTEGHWELHCGYLRRKPGMSADHNRLATRLLVQLAHQLDENAFDFRVNMGHLRRSSQSYYIPDVMVIPMELLRPQRGQRALETYGAPLPLVVEVWSPSTGEYDVDSKLPEYQSRGDFEIWRIHPWERTITAWRRQADGSYQVEVRPANGSIQPIALPNVTIDLDALFD
jgi:Uma2 family endonuclease